MAQQTEQYLKHPIIERLGHWIHVVTVAMLILTGFQIHAPGSFNLFGSLNTTRQLHFVFMYLFVAIGVFHTYQWLASGEWRKELPKAGDFATLGAVLRYYLFLTDEEPPKPGGKYNIMQKLTYAGLFVLAVIQAALGFAMYAPQGVFKFVIPLAGGLTIVRGWHYVISWVFLSFVLMHLYLMLTEDWRLLIAMINGYYTRKAEQA